jgi:hypothetical protein
MKYLVFIVAILLLYSCAYSTSTRSVTDDIWVAVSVLKFNEVEEYQAKLSAHDYNLITSHKIKKGWLQLNDVRWVKNSGSDWQKNLGRHWGYGNTTIIRIENILRIIPLSEKYIKSTILWNTY